MTKPELFRRLSTIRRADFDDARRMYFAGYGSHGISLESTLTRKQVNAVVEWVDRYGRILPSDSNLAVAS